MCVRSLGGFCKCAADVRPDFACVLQASSRTLHVCYRCQALHVRYNCPRISCMYHTGTAEGLHQCYRGPGDFACMIQVLVGTTHVCYRSCAVSTQVLHRMLHVSHRCPRRSLHMCFRSLGGFACVLQALGRISHVLYRVQ
jgi:hypothetical protein